jgi:hypothetical protein
MRAGSSSERMMMASRRIPAPRAVASILTAVSGVANRAGKARKRMSAALVASRPVRPMPRTTAWSVEPVASYSSRTRERMNTS